MAKHTEHQIIVGNIGTVYSGTDAQEAERKFNSYTEQSMFGSGRAGGETGHLDARWRYLLRVRGAVKG